MDEPVEVDNSSITKPASRVMFGGVLALFAGLASNIIVAYIFGAGSSMDAYLTAIVIPSYLQIVFFSSLSFVVIPAFIEAKAKNQDEDAWGLVGTFFWITLIVLSLIAVLGSVFSQPLIRLVVPGFQSTKSALASQMLAISIFTMPFIGISTLTTAIQNARHRFFWPSFAPAFGSMTNVIVLLIFSRILRPVGPLLGISIISYSAVWIYHHTNCLSWLEETYSIIRYKGKKYWQINDATTLVRDSNLSIASCVAVFFVQPAKWTNRLYGICK